MSTNVTQLRSNLWVGNWRPANDAGWLVANGITAVLNTARESNDAYCGVKRYKQGLIDGPGNLAMEITDALQDLNDLLDQGEKVLVHCISGCSRSTYVCARVLAMRENKTYDQVYTEIRGLRPETRWPEILRPIYGT